MQRNDKSCLSSFCRQTKSTFCNGIGLDSRRAGVDWMREVWQRIESSRKAED